MNGLGGKMENDKILDLLIELKTIVAGISTSVDTATDQIAKTNEILMNHEHRITLMESKHVEDKNLKDQVMAWLAKGLVAAVITIGSLTGAAGLIKEIIAK